jgi:hypothetical protein
MPLLSVQDVKLDSQLCGTIGTAARVNTIGCGNKIGQVVKIQLQGTNFLTLCEVEVWGSPMIATPTPTYALGSRLCLRHMLATFGRHRWQCMRSCLSAPAYVCAQPLCGIFPCHGAP